MIPNGSGTGRSPRRRAPRLPPTLPRVMKSHELYPSFPHPSRRIFFKVHLQYLPTQREIITQTILLDRGPSPFRIGPPHPPVFQIPYPFWAEKSRSLIALPFRGTSANPTFSWSAPVGAPVNGYRIDIFQNSLRSTVPPLNTGNVASANLPPTVTSYTVQASDFTVPGFGFMPDTDYYDRHHRVADERWIVDQPH